MSKPVNWTAVQERKRMLKGVTLGEWRIEFYPWITPMVFHMACKNSYVHFRSKRCRSCQQPAPKQLLFLAKAYLK